MKTLLLIMLGVFLGVLLTLVRLAYPQPRDSESPLDIQALRDLGCAPYVGEHRELHPGCDVVKRIEVGKQ